MRVKVCGITQETQFSALKNAGVQFGGLIFYPDSPRYALRSMTTTHIRKENALNKVGVFVNAPVEEVLARIDDCRLDLVQLHGDESPKYCEKIADYISVVKAFRFSETDNISWRLQEYKDVCDMYMIDTEGVGYGGTGKKFDVAKLKDVWMDKPYFLSGLISPDDVELLKELIVKPEGQRLFAVDISTNFEITSGIKDIAKIEKFVKQLNQ